MLRAVIRNYSRRGFSKSSVWRDLEKVKPDQIAKPNEPATDFSKTDGFASFKPSEFEKKILVWSGKFKSKESIPERISISVMENAKSRFRIRASNAMIITCLGLCGIVIYMGKQRQKAGDTILKRTLENDRKILDDFKKNEKN